MILLAALSFLSCGVERQSVKVLEDQVVKTTLFQPMRQTVDELLRIPRQRFGNKAPRSTVERYQVIVEAQLIAFQREADQDLHLVLQSPKTHKTMIAEIPSPSCLKGSPFDDDIKRARIEFIKRFGVPFKTKKIAPQNVTIKGVVFMDKVHGQLGVAPSGIEIHPVTEIIFR